jgi:hypothetical protein
MGFLAIAAGIVIVVGAGLLAGPARRAGHPALGRFIESASLPVSLASFWVAWGLALRDVDWTTLALFPLGYAVWAVRRILRRRRNNA